MKKLRRSPASGCSAAIWHGPGHQTQTKCHLTGKHTVHEAVYGPYSQTVCWRGKKKFITDYYDVPPDED